MPIADWLPYPPPLYINIGFRLSGLRYQGRITLCILSINPDHFGGYQANIELTKKKKNVRIPRAASSTGGASLEVRAKINKQLEKTHRNKFRKWGVIDFHRCKYLLLLGQRFK